MNSLERNYELNSLKREKELFERFEKVKAKGYVKSRFHGTCSVGLTFEKEFGLYQSSKLGADFGNIELKTRLNKNRPITIFNCSPFPAIDEIDYLRLKYGYKDKTTGTKILKFETNAIALSNVGLFYYSKLEVNREEKRVYLVFYNSQKELIEKRSYWSFELLEKRLLLKDKKLAVIDAERKYYYGKEYFKYTKMTLYELDSFEKFIDLIEDGNISIKFKIGVHKTGTHFGRVHDHGTSFLLYEKDLSHLFRAKG